jgi:hypothetical protein
VSWREPSSWDYLIDEPAWLLDQVAPVEDEPEPDEEVDSNEEGDER